MSQKFFFPCIQGTIDKIVRILRRKRMKTTFSPSNTIQKLLSLVKDPVNPKSTRESINSLLIRQILHW